MIKRYIIAFFLLNIYTYQHSNGNCEKEISYQVIEKTIDILSLEEHWTKEGEFDDDCVSARDQYTLACALNKAHIEVRGEYKNRSCEMETVRYFIARHFFKRLKYHPIHGFNSHEKTTHGDVIFLLEKVLKKYKV